MTPIERLRKLLAEATVPYSKPSIVFKDNARVIVWAENEKGRDIATFRHNVTMESDAMLYIEAVRILPALLAAYDARGKYIALLEDNQKECAHHTGHISDRDRATCTRLGCRLHQAKNDADSAVARVEGER